MEVVFTESKGADEAPLLLSTLRLLVPPLRLMSAAIWRVIQEQDVMQYGILADFVLLVTEAVPELLSHKHGIELILGLRAKLILELCRRDDSADVHAIQSHLNRIQLSLPLVKYDDVPEVEDTEFGFVELVQRLIKNSEEREHFFQHMYPAKFGSGYDSAIQTLMWEFLSRLEHLLPVPDLLQTASWLNSESSALKVCEESISNPDNLKSLLHHHKCRGHLESCAPSPSVSTGDLILSALSGKRDAGDPLGTTHCLMDPPDDSVQARIPVCVLEETGSESVVVVSEWSEIELGADQVGDCVPEEETTDSCVDTLDSSVPGGESRFQGNPGEHELGAQRGASTESYVRETGLQPKQDVESSEVMKILTAGGDLYSRTTQEESCNAASTMDSVPVLSHEEAVSLAAPIGIRRSARKPKKTWKIKVVNLQTHKRKQIAPKMVNLQMRKREAIVADCNSAGIETDTDHINSSIGNAADLRILSPDLASTDEKITDTSSEMFSCPCCSFTHTQERYLKSHMKKTHPLSAEAQEKEPHTCQVCGKGYRYPGMLKAHQRTHTGEQPFQCTASLCGRRFAHIQALRRHRLVHAPRADRSPSDPCEADEPDEDDPDEDESQLAESQVTEPQLAEPQLVEQQLYDCLYCGERFSSLSARRDHHKTHPEEELNRCSDCGKQLSCQAALIRHKRGHQDERPHKCTLCQASFSCATSFKRHALTHQPDRPYRCSCGKGFTYRGALLSHQRTHTAERPYRCSHCAKSFLYPGALHKHEWTHSKEKPYLCSHCGKCFKRERTLSSHMAGHTKEKIFKCPMCDKTFAYKASLTRHQLTHTGERPYLCSECGKTFFSFGELLKHQRYHTGHKPFSCSHCDKSFTQACYLQLHMRYHTGVRPYVCPHCNKSFFTSCRLKRHVQVHTGEKPFECGECGKRFRQAYVLKVHQRTHLGSRAERMVATEALL